MNKLHTLAPLFALKLILKFMHWKMGHVGRRRTCGYFEFEFLAQTKPALLLLKILKDT